MVCTTAAILYSALYELLVALCYVALTPPPRHQYLWCFYSPSIISLFSESNVVSGKCTKEKLTSAKWAKWELDSLEMDKKFSNLVMKLRKSLESRIILKKLTTCLMDVSCYKQVFESPNQCLFREKREDLQKATDIYDVWDVIRGYFSYFSYGLIEHLTDHLGSEEDKENFINYVKEFEEYAKRKIHCPKKFGSDSRDDSTEIIVKLDSTYDKCELLYLKQFQEILSKILKVNANVLLLREINEGCIQLVFEVPSFIPSDIFPLTPNQEAELRDLGVIQLDCGTIISEYRYISVCILYYVY